LEIGFRCRKDQKYEVHGVLVFCTNEKCKNSGKLPPGHINEFPLQRKWKSGDSNQIMLIHCRSAHNGEMVFFEAQKEKSTLKAASLQPDVSKLLKKTSVILYNAAKQRN
jgi:hypothetical protein